MKWTASLILTFLLLACHHEKKIHLEFNPPLGATYHMIQIYKEVITEPLYMGERKLETTANTGYRFEVIEKQEFTTTIEARFESIKLKVVTPLGTFQFNSSKPDRPSASPFTFFYKKLLGQKFRLIIKRNGKVLTVRGLDDWMSGMLDSLGLKDKKIRTEIVNTFNQVYAETMLRQSFDRIFRIFPPQPLKVKASWKTEEKEETAYFPLFKKTKWTLTEYSPSKALIEGYTTISSDDSSTISKTFKVKRKYHAWGIETANFEIDPATGWILSAKRLLFVKAKTTVQAVKKKAPRFEFPLKIQRQIRFLPLNAVQ